MKKLILAAALASLAGLALAQPAPGTRHEHYLARQSCPHDDPVG